MEKDAGKLSNHLDSEYEDVQFLDEKEVLELYKEFYKNEPFIKIVDAPPATKHTWGSNFEGWFNP